jgi:tRNA nucleotidyltransferase (CCA-adding enzyme)
VDIHIYDHHLPSPEDIHGSSRAFRVGATVPSSSISFERGIEITPDEATVMMLGLYEDTGTSPFHPSPEDFKAAGYLLQRRGPI